jgi:hypothetical protein
MDVLLQLYANQWMIGASLVMVILLVIVLVQGVKLHKLQKMIQHVMPESGDDFLAILDQQQTWNEGTDRKLEELSLQDQRLLGRINHAFQYRGMKTYSAFEQGGRQLSFSIAMLDAHLNGWVMSSLYAGAAGSSVYFKEIANGLPKERLTPEEEEAVKAALAEK